MAVIAGGDDNGNGMERLKIQLRCSTRARRLSFWKEREGNKRGIDGHRELREIHVDLANAIV